MQIKYGGHAHISDEVNLVRYDVRHRLSGRGKRISRIITAYLQGELQYSTQADITTKVQQIIDLYSQDHLFFGLYQDDGTLTPHQLQNDAPLCMSGVRVIQRSWPKGDPAEYATKRTFSVTLQAEYQDVESNLVSWQEEVRTIGNCGPRFEIVECFAGPRVYQTAVSTAQHIVQRGSAVGYLAWVEPPGPLYPAIEHQDRREIELVSGTHQGLQYAFFPSKWAYHFTSDVDRAGTIPNTI